MTMSRTKQVQSCSVWISIALLAIWLLWIWVRAQVNPLLIINESKTCLPKVDGNSVVFTKGSYLLTPYKTSYKLEVVCANRREAIRFFPYAEPDSPSIVIQEQQTTYHLATEKP